MAQEAAKTPEPRQEASQEGSQAPSQAASQGASSEAGRVPVGAGERSGIPSMFEQAWQPVMSLRREMDRLFDDFFSRSMAPWGRGGDFDPFRSFETIWRPSAPAIDLVEREKEYVVTAELPGLDEKALEVKVAGNTLSIRGQKEEERKEERESYRMSERRYGSFQRTVRLPEDVDLDKIDARFAKGVLTVTLPKNEETLSKHKKIEVKTG